MAYKLQVFRVCAVCGKRHGVTYGFKTILARNGIKGDKATKECVAKLKSPREEAEKRRERLT
jgi:hypothetical protein